MALNIRKKYKHLQRYRQISQVFVKNGLGFLLDRFDLKKFVPLKERFEISDTPENISVPVRLRKVFQELGPTYVKLGQILSTRPDIFPPDYIIEFKKLQDKVPPVEFNQIDNLLKEELGQDYKKKVFKDFEKEATAGASIAQTHRATLRNGEPVMVKVQRPFIQEKIKVDLGIITDLAELAVDRNILPEFIDPVGLVEEFKDSLKKELNFKQELANIKRFQANFADEDSIISPKVYEKYSTRRVLIMEEIKGKKLSEIENFDDIENKKLSRLGAHSFLKQVMIHGFFHADPHPGNIFIIGGDKIAYIDFGMMGQISSEDRDLFSLLFAALLRRNVEVITDTILEIGNMPYDLNKRKFKLDIEEFIYNYYNRKLEDINFKVLFEDLQKIVFKHHIRLPQEFFLLFRALSLNEGVGSTLDPEFNIVEIGNEFIQDLVFDRLKPDNLLKKVSLKLWRFVNNIKGYPSDISEIFDMIKEDRISINFKHMNLEKLIKEIDFASNRLSISMIISALIVGSSMIIQSEVEPLVSGVPVLGFVGYTLAGIMGIWLVISILRSGRF
ncbi:MAG: ABC1 kinase family protein [Bacillota bacterium]